MVVSMASPTSASIRPVRAIMPPTVVETTASAFVFATSMREALFEITSKKMGITTVVDSEGKLVGIITRGDIIGSMVRGDE